MYQKPDIEDVRGVYAAGEIGYELKVSAVKVTPTMGVGALMMIVSVKGDTTTESTPLIYPGAVVRYDIPNTVLSVGADARVLYLTDADQTALAFHATTGFRF
jgi:hypothetical protein